MRPKIAILIPDRGDRPVFMRHCIDIIENQTLKPEIILVVNEPPKSDAIDITYRYRTGYNELKDGDYDLIFFIENDDYYAPDYLEMMHRNWIAEGKPNMIGTGSTLYYHIGILKYTTMKHRSRASAMNTAIVPGLDLKWCADSEPFTDMFLWMREDANDISRVVFYPDKIYSLGIKHGMGKCGGMNHVNRLHRYDNSDADMSYLRGIVDKKSFEFYKKLHNEIHSKIAIH